MRVLHLSSGNLYGGIESMLHTIATYREHVPEMEPHFGLYFDDRNAQELRESGVPVHIFHSVRLSRPWTVWRARNDLARLLKQIDFDAVICHECWVHTISAPVLRKHRKRIAFWSHAPHYGQGWLDWFTQRTPPDLAICNSRFTAKSIETFLPGIPQEVIYCPVPAPEIPKTDRATLRKQLQTSEQDIVIVQVGRFERWKGHIQLLQALGHMNNVPGWTCWQVGKPQRPHEEVYFHELHQLAQNCGIGDRVRFVGWRSDVPDVLRAADIFCQPNLTPDSFGIVFIEALYAGLVTITSDIGGPSEILENQYGITLPPNDIFALCRTLQNYVQDATARRKLACLGLGRAKELCDPEQKLKELYNSLKSLSQTTGKA